VALAECCLAGGSRAPRPGGEAGSGCVVALPAGADQPAPLAALFSESAARAIAIARPGAEAAFAELCAEHELPATRLGRTGGQNLEVNGLFTVSVGELSEVSRRTLPALFGPR